MCLSCSALVRLVASALLLTSLPAFSQALDTAARHSELSVFAEAQTLNPDYHNSTRDLGAVGGLNYTYYIHKLVVPSFELRGSYTGNATVADEKAVLGGLRLDLWPRVFHRVRPYGNFLIGMGEIDFHHPVITPRGPYAHDNSIVYNYGFGVNYEFMHHIALQAEFQQQRWNLAGPKDPYTMAPSAVSAGLRYRIPFRDRDHR